MMEDKRSWFDRAIADEGTSHKILVDGLNIAYTVWGAEKLPGVLLLHGSNAHRRWWQFVAPFLSQYFRVAAMDLSGHGDSDWRAQYSGKAFAEEARTVIRAAALGDNPYVVAHSFGGFVGLELGHYFGAELGGIIFADFTVAPRERYIEWGLQRSQTGAVARPTRVYATRAAALERFRLIPEQPCGHPDIVSYLGEHALRSVPGGYTWKFDPTLFDELEMGVDQVDKFIGLPCRSAVLLGEHSKDEGAQDAEHMRQISNGNLPILTLPDTHHHFMLDDPMASLMAMSGLLSAWHQQSA